MLYNLVHGEHDQGVLVKTYEWGLLTESEHLL